MNIDPKEKIAGFPITRIRDFLKRDRGMMDAAEFSSRMKISNTQARLLIKELVRLGYLEAQPQKDGVCHYEQTELARTLALSSAAKPISRKTAERKLSEFLERVLEVRDNDYYLFEVQRAFLFGSFLGTKEKLSDIDLAIELTPKTFSGKDFGKLCENRIHEAFAAGRHFSSFLEQAIYPQHEVWTFLKARSRSLSLHPYLQEMEKHAEHKLIYSNEK